MITLPEDKNKMEKHHTSSKQHYGTLKLDSRVCVAVKLNPCFSVGAVAYPLSSTCQCSEVNRDADQKPEDTQHQHRNSTATSVSHTHLYAQLWNNVFWWVSALDWQLCFFCMQRNATQCNAMQRNATQCNWTTMQFSNTGSDPIQSEWAAFRLKPFQLIRVSPTSLRLHGDYSVELRVWALHSPTHWTETQLIPGFLNQKSSCLIFKIYSSALLLNLLTWFWVCTYSV